MGRLRRCGGVDKGCDQEAGGENITIVIPGCADRRRPGIHTFDGGYGVRVRASCVPECRKRRTVRGLDSSKEYQDQQDDDDKCQPAAAIISGAIERAAPDAAKAAQQSDNENDQDNSSDRHVASPPSPAVGTCCAAIGWKTNGNKESSCGFPAGYRLPLFSCKCGITCGCVGKRIPRCPHLWWFRFRIGLAAKRQPAASRRD